MQTATFPERPRPIIDLPWNPFYGPGIIPRGHAMPTGMVVQPTFIVFGTARSALQSSQTGSGPTTSEWVNRLDLDAVLNFTFTERIVFETRPLDRAGLFSGYRFKPDREKGTTRTYDGNAELLYFEGDFNSIFPNLDPRDVHSLDYHFAIGRQGIVLQDGLMANDAMDSLGVTRSSLSWFGAAATRATAIFAWGDVHRNNNVRDQHAKLAALSFTSDYRNKSFDLDLAYVDGGPKTSGDSAHAGVGMTTQLGLLNTTVRVNSSRALNKRSAQSGNGTLVFTQFSFIQPYSDNLVYVDAFWGIDHYTSASRGPEAGGPLGQTGLLFASVGIGRFRVPIANRPDESVGGALGYQIFFDREKRSQIVFEVGARASTDHAPTDTKGYGARYQHAIGRHLVWIFDAFASRVERQAQVRTFRTELLVKF